MTFCNINDIPEKEIIPGYFLKLVHTENVTIAYWRILKNMAMPEHAHPNEQTTNIIEGEFEIIINNQHRIIKSGDIVVIPKDIPHSGKALTDCKIIDVFYPLRNDYK